MSAPLTKPQIWGQPIALGLMSAVGLLVALIADGLWDAVSWIALATPVFVCIFCVLKDRKP